MTEVWSVIAKDRQNKIEIQQNAIRKYFDKFNSPFYYISYTDFCKNFEVHAGKNFKQQNLYIIDTHLKYRQWIYQQMAPYKWTPIILFAILKLVRLRRPVIIFPFVYTSLFDHYLHPFFVWLHKDDKIINMKYQFASKLAKIKNKQRRVRLFKSLQKSLKREDENLQLDQKGEKKTQIPYKYIKFGFPTEFVFHGMSDENTQLSTILQSTLFQNYMHFRYPTLQSFTHFLSHLNYLKNKFRQYKKDPQNKKYFLDLNEFMRFKDIKQNQIYQLSTCVEKRVRRWIQLYMFEKTKTIFYSGFTLDKILYLYKHKHMSEQPKYPIEQNAADLTIYYSLILLPSLLLKIIRR